MYVCLWVCECVSGCVYFAQRWFLKWWKDPSQAWRQQLWKIRHEPEQITTKKWVHSHKTGRKVVFNCDSFIHSCLRKIKSDQTSLERKNTKNCIPFRLHHRRYPVFTKDIIGHEPLKLTEDNIPHHLYQGTISNNLTRQNIQWIYRRWPAPWNKKGETKPYTFSQ